MKCFLVKLFLSLLVCLLLTGCEIGFFPYYNTPKEAYLAEPYHAHVENIYFNTVNAEIDCIELNEENAIWFAVVNDTYVIESFMKKKDGKYRVGKLTSIYDFTDADIADTGSAETISFSHYTLSSDQTAYWALILTETLPELDQEHQYTVKGYTVSLDGQDTDLTLVYYMGE